MRRSSVGRRGAWGFLAAAALIAAALATVLLSTAAGGPNGSYRVRAIFDDAANLTEGEEVKVDEVKVGTVGEIVPTPQGKAAVSLHIENPGFQDFRADASCTINIQSLLGEKYVNCAPSQPRPEGTPLPPPLHVIASGEGAGERLLPLTNTHSPVGADQLEDITRLPEAQRLRIILNELGAGFAGRGSELHEVIQRANPGLHQLERVLHIFASQNRVLANLAEESNRALAPWAANRGSFAGFIAHSNTVARASARHLAALKEDLAQFPAFLEQLGPATQRIGQFAEQTTPTFEYLNAAAPGLDQAFENLAPFSNSTDAYLKSLGRTGKITGPALNASKPLLRRLEALGGAAKPFAQSFAKLLASKHGIRETGGLERIMDFIFLGAGTTNGYDKLGHFLRAEVVGDTCLGYKTVTSATCSANFVSGGATASAAKASAATSTVMKRTLAILKGVPLAKAIAEYPGREGEGRTAPGPTAGATAPPSAPVGGAASGTTSYTPPSEPSGAGERLLEYLLGS